MKTEFKDFLLSSLSVSLLLVITVLIIYSVRSIVSAWLGSFYPLADILLFLLIYGLITVFYLRVLNRLFPLREGEYDMSDVQFILWKHHAVVGEFGKLALKPFFPVFIRPVFYSLFGTKIGKNVAIGGTITDPLLVRIGDFAILGQDSVVVSHTMTSDKFYLKQVVIDKGATVGINAVIMPGVVIGENAVVAPGAVVSMDTRIPPNEFWGGVPARKIKDIEPVK